jgi:hypothetical protein
MHRALALLVGIALAGCDADDAPAPSATPRGGEAARADPGCASAADGAIGFWTRRAVAAGSAAAARLTRLHGLVEARCRDDRWSAAAVACARAGQVDPDRCGLDEAQVARLHHAVVGAIGDAAPRR